MSKSNYIASQMAVLIVPPLLAPLYLHINHYMNYPIEEFAGYACGVSGFILIIILHSAGLSDVAGSNLFMVLYLVMAILFFQRIYKKEGKRNIICIGVNLFLSLWSVAFGVFWMFSAMQ